MRLSVPPMRASSSRIGKMMDTSGCAGAAASTLTRAR
jgi:hypothetical protein